MTGGGGVGAPGEAAVGRPHRCGGATEQDPASVPGLTVLVDLTDSWANGFDSGPEGQEALFGALERCSS